jgi:hypothetical protein
MDSRYARLRNQPQDFIGMEPRVALDGSAASLRLAYLGLLAVALTGLHLETRYLVSYS